MRNARRRDGPGSPPRARHERGTVTGEPSALKGARWVRREAARKRPAPTRARDLAAQPACYAARRRPVPRSEPAAELGALEGLEPPTFCSVGVGTSSRTVRQWS